MTNGYMHPGTLLSLKLFFTFGSKTKTILKILVQELELSWKIWGAKTKIKLKEHTK